MTPECSRLVLLKLRLLLKLLLLLLLQLLLLLLEEGEKWLWLLLLAYARSLIHASPRSAHCENHKAERAGSSVAAATLLAFARCLKAKHEI